MRRPRTVNGYSIKNILDEYKYKDIADHDFWDAAYKFFGQNQMADMRAINMSKHSEMVWEAKAHCEEHGGFWGEEDEDEEFMASLWDIGGRPAPRFSGMFLTPLSDEEYDRQNNPHHKRDPYRGMGLTGFESDDDYGDKGWGGGGVE